MYDGATATAAPRDATTPPASPALPVSASLQLKVKQRRQDIAADQTQMRLHTFGMKSAASPIDELHTDTATLAGDHDVGRLEIPVTPGLVQVSENLKGHSADRSAFSRERCYRLQCGE